VSWVRAQRSTAWRVGLGGTLTERLAIATNPASTAADLEAVSPRAASTDDGAVDLILEILRHPTCPSGLVGRYAICPHDQVRRVVVEHSAAPSTALQVLAYDADDRIRRTALHRLTVDVDRTVRVAAERALLDELG